MKLRFAVLVIAAALLLAFAAPASAYTAADLQGGAPSGLLPVGDALLVTDVYNKVVWKLEDDAVALYAGQIAPADVNGEPVGAYVDGDGADARFLEPWAIAPYLEGYLVSDASANVVRYLDGERVYTAAGSGSAGSADGMGAAASFHRPTGLAAGEDGLVYLADTGNGAIRTLDSGGTVSTLLTGLNAPTGLCWADGALYIAETGAHRLCRYAGGKLEVLAGGERGDACGSVEDARFDSPQGVAVLDGAVLIADTGNSAVKKLQNGFVTTVAAAGDHDLSPVKPRGLLIRDGTLLAADVFSGTIAEYHTAVGEVSYPDVDSGAWYAGAVSEATLRGLMEGLEDGRFAPEENLTRAQLTAMLSRLHTAFGEALPERGQGAAFSDVAEDAWYAAPVHWAASLGVVSGYDGRFSPNDNITRQDAVAILCRYAAATGRDTAGKADISGFTDGGDIAPYAVEPVRWAVSAGLLTGYDHALSPRDSLTRAEAAALMIRFMNR